MPRVLPDHPDLDHLKNQAKTLLQSVRDGSAEGTQRFRDAGVDGGDKLADAQHVIAREYGFKSWPELKMKVESLTADPTTAFYLAIKGNNVAKVRDLLGAHPELKAIINRGTDVLSFGATPLLAAVQRSNREMIDLLLAAGADLSVKSDWWAGGFSVLESSSDELMPFLVERGAIVDAVAAAKFGLVDQLARLVAANPQAVHQRSGDGKTPLHWAKDVPTARYLVEHGADLNARDVDHESTAAQYAIRERQEVARYLVDAGADADIFLIAALGDLDRARALVERDPTVVERIIGPRHFPMQNPRAGGSIYVWTLGQGKTPQMVAQEFGHRDVYDYLMDHSSNDVKVTQACLLGDEALFEQFMAQRDRNAPISAELVHRLVGAAVGNNTKAVRLLLKAGWPVAANGLHGGTSLHWASWHGNAAMVREILSYHPPLDSRDNEHKIPPLGWALHGSLHGWHAKTGDYAAVVTALIGAGAKTENPLPTLEGSDAAMAAYQAGKQRKAKTE
ncbi:MAG TPA: ankyrin repeat domain-containing protein [Gemmatimonadales bacterium]|jgi:ankyrin repeat protein